MARTVVGVAANLCPVDEQDKGLWLQGEVELNKNGTQPN